MLLYGIAFLAAIIIILIGHKRRVSSAIYVILVFLAVFNTNNADRYANELTYNGYYRAKEHGYRLLIQLSNRMGLEFQEFFGIFVSATIILLFLFVSRYTKHTWLFGLTYLFYPFPLSLPGIRTTLATMIVLNALPLLQKRRTRNTLLFILVIILASLIHFSALGYLVLALCNTRVTNKNIFEFSVAAVGLGCIMAFTNVFNEIAEIVIKDPESTKWFLARNLNGFIVAAVFHIASYFVFYLFGMKMIHRDEAAGVQSKLMPMMKCIFRLNALSVLFIVFYPFNYLFYERLYMIYTLLNRNVMIEVLKDRGVRWHGNEKTIYIIVFIVTLLVWGFSIKGAGYLHLMSSVANNSLFGK